MFNWIDLLLVLVFVSACWAGWRRGFVSGAVDLLVLVTSMTIAYSYYPEWGERLQEWFPRLGVWLLPASFLSIFIVASMLLGWLASWFKRRIPDSYHQMGFNRILGLAPGAINGWLAGIIISALLLSLPLKDTITQEARESRLANPLAMQSEWINRRLAPVFDQAVRHTMNSLTVRPESGEHLSLGYQFSNPRTRPSLEDRMLKLVNEERTKHGLKLLKRDPELQQVARAHSRDMFARGYFAHENPDGKSPFDRMEAASVKFKAAGENLALAQTLEIAHENLMNSPGHRANILNPAFGRLGIGVLDGGFYGLMISQEFRD
jgi:uncharacterized protein YkwD